MKNSLENLSISLTLQYLKKYPDQATKYCKTNEKQVLNIKKSLNDKILPNIRTTVADKLTSELLELVFNHEKKDRDKIQNNYNNQKQIEMMIGKLLERYIANIGHKYGWAFTGECIKSVDFIKKEGNRWTTLQVKNSDNTENSSSQSVRDGTKILKWVRRNSKKGTYLWDKFPDENLKNNLSELEFSKFVKNHFKNNAESLKIFFKSR